jgi:ankyrin repeat protein
LGRVLETHEETQDLVTRALKWLAFGKKPLPGKALVEALALSPGDSRLDSEAMTSEEDILKWCSSLVRRRVDGDGLELAHFTVKEYLVSIDRESDPRFGKFKISETESDLLLGSICLTYLTLDTLAGTPLPVDIFDGIYTDSEEMGDSDDAQSEDSTEGEASDEKLQESNDEQYLNGRQQNKKDELNCDNESTDEDTKSAKVSYGSPDIVFDRYLDAYPLLLYAANYWSSHCWLHLRDQTIVSLTHKLFHPQKSNQFLWWSYTYLCDAQRDQWREMFSNTTTLHWAALLGIEEVCAWLVQEGSDVTRGSSLGTPLDCLLLGSTAIWHFDLDDLEDRYLEEEIQRDGELCARASIVDLFIKAGLKLNETSNNDPPWLPLELALVTDRNNDDLIALILQAGAKVDLAALGVVERYLQKSNQSDINCDIPRGYLTLFENITAKDVQENAREEFSKLSKQLAGRGLQKLELHEVLEHQDASTIVDVDRLQTWFFQAMEHGQGNDVATLITTLRQYFTSAEAESTLSMGLRIAAYNGHESIVEGLLKSCVNPNKVDEDGDSALHCSLSEYNDIDAFVTIRIMKTLVAHGADLTLRNKNGELPLHLAAKSKKEGILKAVFEAMENHAAQTMLDSSSPSVLQYAVETGLDESISYLLEIYDDIDQNKHRSEKGVSLLGTAAQRRSPVALRELLDRGLSTEALDADGSSAIYNAVAHGQLETFKVLMEFGANDTSSRDDGRRAIHAAAETHFGAAFQMLEDLLHVGEDPNATTKKGYTPLQLVLPVPNRAFTQQSARKIKLLTEQSGINITCRDHQGRTPLMLCLDCLVVKALKGEETRYVDEGAVLDSIRVILDHGTDLNLVDTVGRTALHYACQAELTTVSFGAIEMLVNRGSMLCHRSEAGITPFELLFNHYVKRLDGANGSVPSTTLSADEVLRFTIEHMPGQHLNDHLSNGLPALANALKLRCADAVELLLSKEEVDVDAKSQDKDQVSSLEIAAGYGCSEAVARTLLHRSSRPTYSLSPIQGYTILHFAVQERSSQTCLRMLLEDNENLDLEVRDRHGHTPLGVAVTAGCLAAVLLLLKAGADVNNPSPNSETRPLHLAASSGSLSILDILIQHKAELNLSGSMGITPLIIAASKGFDQAVRSLVKAGVDITHCTEDGTSALIAAMLNEHWATSKLLLGLGTNVNYLSPTPWRTILHLISQRGPWKLIQLLLRMGADQEALDCEGATPFLTSAIARRWDIVSQYLAHGTNFNAKSFSGLSAMHIALQAGVKEAVKLLHRHGAPLLQEIRDQQGTLTGNSLTCAVQSGNLGVFQIISKEGAVLDFESDEGWKIAHYAVLAQDGPVRELLLSYNIDWKPYTATFRCDTLNVVGASPLHLAAVQGRNASINFLKDHGFIQNIDTPTGLAHCYTPLHLATISRNVSTVTLLLEVGANADVVDGLDEKTALHHAAELGLADVVATLLKHGCHPNMLDSHGMTPELLSIENGHLDVTKMLARHLDTLEGQNGATTDTKSEGFALTTTTTTTASVTTPWRLPLPRGPYVRKVLTGDVSIYAVDNTKCPPALRELLEQHEGKEVDRLGTPCKRRIT